MPNLLTFNGWRVNFDLPQFEVHWEEMPDNRALRDLREQKPDWFFHWSRDIVYGVPLSSSASRWGQPYEIEVDDILGLRFLASRIVHEFPRLLQRESFRRRPYTFLGEKDAVADVANKLGLPDLARQFAIRSKFELDTKIFEIVNDEPFLGVILGRHTSWSCTAELANLQRAGVDLSGLCVVRRQTEAGQRRLVGRIARLQGAQVELSESYDDTTSIAASEVWLEGSLQSFARCLKTILGPRYRDFEQEIGAWEAKTFAGPKFESLLQKVGEKLSRSPMDLGGITASLGERIAATNSNAYTSIRSIAKVECCFDAAKTRRDDLPWRGLKTYGPFSKETFPRRSPKIWVFCPDSSQRAVENFIRHLTDGVVLTDEHGNSRPCEYSKRFDALFHLVNPQFQIKKIGVFKSSRADVAANYVKTITECLATENLHEVTAAIVIVPDEPTTMPAANNPYLQAKALLLMNGIPVQEIRLPTITKPPQALQYPLRNIALALYAKMGGTPWTIANDLTVHDELVIGMGTVETSDSRFTERQRFVGITTVFSGEGNYLLGNVSENCSYSEYPQVLYDSTMQVLRKIKERNGWQKDDTIRIIFHAKKPLKDVEVGDIIASCVDELRGEHNIEFAFLNIVEDHPFYAFDPRKNFSGPGAKGALVPDRGTIVQLGRYSRLVCTLGPRLMKHTAMPQPLMVHLHEASTYNDLDYLAEQVLKFTAMSWRSTDPSPQPVSIYYSELIAKLLSRLKTVKDWSPTPLNTRLPASRWFL